MWEVMGNLRSPSIDCPWEVGDTYDISQWAVALQIREPSKDPMACQSDSQTLPASLPSVSFHLYQDLETH